MISSTQSQTTSAVDVSELDEQGTEDSNYEGVDTMTPQGEEQQNGQQSQVNPPPPPSGAPPKPKPSPPPRKS